jgi:toxin ParE1/3/4
VIPVRILPQAEAELLHEVAYYSNGRMATGIRFQSAVDASIELAARHPLGGAPSAKGTRSALVKGLPFSIVYRADERELLVAAIAPHRRRPGYWQPRIG